MVQIHRVPRFLDVLLNASGFTLHVLTFPGISDDIYHTLGLAEYDLDMFFDSSSMNVYHVQELTFCGLYKY